MNIKLLVLLVSIFSSSYSAVQQGTLIHTTKGLVPVQQITPSDRILSSGPTDRCTLIHLKSYSDYVYEIILESESLYVSSNQLLYDPVIEEWVKAQDLTHSNTLLDIHGNQVQCLGVTKLDTQNTVYEISLSAFHIFFIGHTGILAHNAIIFLAPAIPTTIATIAKVSTIIGTIFGALWKAHSDYKHAATPNSFSTTASPPIKPPDEEKDKQHPHGMYEDASYHHKNCRGIKNPSPKNGQKALDQSIQISPNSQTRVGISEREIVVLNQTAPGLYHSHTRTWKELQMSQKLGHRIMRLLIKNKWVTRHGKIL